MSNDLYRSAFILLWSALPCIAGQQSHRVKITIIRQESSVHTTVTHRDSYIAQVHLKDGKQFIARILDQYPGYDRSLNLQPLSDGAMYSVSLRRAADCDSLNTDAADVGQMKCFEAIHGSWRLPRSVSQDQWWK